MKQMDDAVIYNEVLEDLVVADPLGGETQADKELRESSARWEKSRLALQEIVTQDWGKIPAAAAGTPPSKRKARSNG